MQEPLNTEASPEAVSQENQFPGHQKVTARHEGLGDTMSTSRVPEESNFRVLLRRRRDTELSETSGSKNKILISKCEQRVQMPTSRQTRRSRPNSLQAAITAMHELMLAQRHKDVVPASAILSLPCVVRIVSSCSSSSSCFSFPSSRRWQEATTPPDTCDSMSRGCCQ